MKLPNKSTFEVLEERKSFLIEKVKNLIIKAIINGWK
jgi:hypothetical protein